MFQQPSAPNLRVNETNVKVLMLVGPVWPSDTLYPTIEKSFFDPSGKIDLSDPLLVGVHIAQPREFPRPTVILHPMEKTLVHGKRDRSMQENMI
jgi:hypothetical protein